MIKYRLKGCIVTFMAIAWSVHVDAATIHLDAHDVATAGIKTVVLVESLHTQELAAQGTVLNPAAIMQTQSRLVTADANVSSARAEMVFASEQAVQNRKLYTEGHNISRTVLQQSIAAADSATAALTAAQAKQAAEETAAITQWGPVMTSAMQDNAPIMGNIANGAVSVIGVSLPPGSALSQPPTTATANLGNRSYNMTLIGAVPGMLGGVPGEALLYSLPTQSDLPIGIYLNAGVPSGSQIKGVTVPASAIIWENSKPIAYRADGSGNFEPVDVSTASPVHGGYFVSSELIPGDHIVSQGAELLAAAPTAPTTVKAKAGTADPDDD